MFRRHTLQYSIVALLVGLVGHGVAGAQGDAADSAGVDGEPADTELSIPEQVARGGKMVDRMTGIQTEVQGSLDEARELRDVVKTLCLDDKVSQLAIALRNGEERNEALGVAAERGDKELTDHEFTILSVLFQRAEVLDGEARQCVGKEVGLVVGESSTTASIDSGMPNENVTVLPNLVITVPPSCASCVR